MTTDASRRRYAAVLTLCLLLAPDTARADESPTAASWTIVRVTPLFGHWETLDFGEALTLPLLGVQFGYIARQRWAVEAGADVLLGLEGLGFDALVRGGYAIGLHGSTAALDSGARGFVTPLLGYRFARRPASHTSDGYGPVNETHSAQLGIAYDLLLGRRTAFDLRLFTAFEYAFVSNKRPDDFSWEYTTQEPMTTSLQAGIALGVGFGRPQAPAK